MNSLRMLAMETKIDELSFAPAQRKNTKKYIGTIF